MSDKAFTIRIGKIPTYGSSEAFNVKVTSPMGRVLANEPFEARKSADRYADGWIIGFKVTGDEYKVVDATHQ